MRPACRKPGGCDKGKNCAYSHRPSLLDVYAEYAAYHNHQLDKGWKS